MTSPLHGEGRQFEQPFFLLEKALGETASKVWLGPFFLVPKSLNMCTHTCMFMSTKTITVTEDSYFMLKSAKREDESFSELIKRLFAPKANIMQYAGLIKEDEG